MALKRMYIWEGIENFGDILNKSLFEKLYGIKFNFTQKYYEAEIVAIGSLLESFMYSGNKIRKAYQAYQVATRRIKEIDVLGSGFQYEHQEYNFCRKMNFRIVRGKLTERILRNNGYIKGGIILGDPGMLSSYMYTKSSEKYLLGIVPHFNDLNSPLFYDIYKKYGDESILINVRDEPEQVIKEISGCKNIISSSLHGIIVADSFGIPNLWIENKYKSVKEENRFKYLDYYSSIGIEEISPIQAIDFIKEDIKIIMEKHHKKYTEIERKQKELYTICNEYFTSRKNIT
jgi:pyruvyltransferase